MPDIWHGDCLEVLRTFEADSIDSLVTDPPASISFMGRAWDGDRGGRDQWVGWLTEVMAECLRVTRPGGHGFVWALPRRVHWTMLALEDAGWEIRDCVVHITGQGFPKSLDIGKAIDRMAGAEREVVGPGQWANRPGTPTSTEDWRLRAEKPRDVTAPATDAARQWDGWGSALKPSAEYWVLIRKPFKGTIAGNVLKHGTGGLNIDGCRIGTETRTNPPATSGYMEGWGTDQPSRETKGRWPANVILSESAAAVIDEQSGVSGSGSGSQTVSTGVKSGEGSWIASGTYAAGTANTGVRDFGDTGGASRFFPVFDDPPFLYSGKAPTKERPVGPDGTKHPTVKSLKLMSWLTRLITPPQGVVLDPFAGSGATLEAALMEGFDAIGIEAEETYLPLIEQRLIRTGRYAA